MFRDSDRTVDVQMTDRFGLPWSFYRVREGVRPYSRTPEAGGGFLAGGIGAIAAYRIDRGRGSGHRDVGRGSNGDELGTGAAAVDSRFPLAR